MRQGGMPSAVPEHSVLQEQQPASPNAWVAVRMTPASLFEQAAASMPAPKQQQQRPQHQFHQQLQLQPQQQQYTKPKRSCLAALLTCSCCGRKPVVIESSEVAPSSVGSFGSDEADASGKPG
jgi:hypothetical protein